MKDKIFYTICLGFTLGVLMRSFLFIDFYLIIILSIVGVLSFLFFIYFQKNKLGIICAIFIFSLSLGMIRLEIRENMNLRAEKYLEDKITEKIKLSGIVIDYPIRNEDRTRFVLKLEEYRDLRVLVNTNSKQDIKYGDRVSVVGKLEKPENFITETGKYFDYINFLKKDKIFYIVSFADVEINSTGNGNILKNYLFIFKNLFLKKIDYAIPPPESNLMSGLILGERANFKKEERENFVRTGTIHIIALSGYNITIVAEWFMKIFKFLPKNSGIGVGIFSIFFFVLMTGATATGVRAGIMAVLVLVARATGRDYDVARALFLAGFVMILANPFILAFDVSFQLSFIATIAVIFLTPRVEKYFLWVTSKFGLRDIFAVTFSAYIFVLPFILYKMGNISVIAFLANILILPFIPFTMLLGFVTGIFGFVFEFLSLIFGYIAYLFLYYELSVINFLSNIFFASFSIPDFPLFLTILIYAYFIYFLFGKSIKKFFKFEKIDF